MPKIFKLTIEYDGTLFKGWQTQKSYERTVQVDIEQALKKILKKNVKVIGSGRTDSGVHAIGQVANFTAETRMTTAEMQRALNAYLPEDVSISKVTLAPAEFHAQYSAKKKCYRYTILNRTCPSPLLRTRVLYHPYKINLKRMKEEANTLIGEHDFRCFMASDPAQRDTIKNKDTVRNIYKITIHKIDDIITIDITANGFLYKMVRNIIGTLISISDGRRPKGSMKNILKSKDRTTAGETAPAHGLCLISVDY
jgi:tRNA pseudouridine38-40 synthase